MASILKPRGARLCEVLWFLRLSCLLILAMSHSAEGALYSCTESSGVTVITDSPAQLSGCTLLTNAQPSTPERTDPAPVPSQPRLTAPVVPPNPKPHTS